MRDEIERPAAPATLIGAEPGVLPDADALALAHELPTGESLGMDVVRLTQRQLAWRKFRRHKLAMGAAIVLLLVTAAVVLAPVLAPRDYSDQDLLKQLRRPGEGGLLGTDTLGRDQLSRLLYGGRVSLVIGVGVAMIATILGTVMGALAGFFGRWMDTLLMRVTDLFLSVPLLVVLIMMTKLLGGSVLDIVLVLSLFFWMPLARIVRGLFLSLKEKEFVEAARSIGAGNTRIISRHILPNAFGPIIVNATLSVAAAILAESTLSFLGFGVQPPTPTWGNMLYESRDLITVAPWLTWFPGLFILIAVLCVNFVGDGLRDALDPTQRRMRA